MCGIVAVSSDAGPVDVGGFDAALTAIRHRGPDGRGAWFSPDRATAIGHVRLAVVDLEGGAQPFASEDGAIHAAVNGELYDDGDRLRRQLIARGHRFRSRSDAELVVHLYEERGADLVRELRGEYAFVLHDARRGELLAARDPFGVKPLVWRRGPEGLAIASEAKALFALGAPAAWDLESVFHAMSFQYLLPDRTLFQGVRSLPPGGRLRARAGEVRVDRHADLDFPLAAGAPSLDDARVRELLVLEVRERLEDAVRVRLRGDAEVGCLLSGGLDSSLVAALATRLAGPRDLFTIGFETPPYDELEAARATARVLGGRHHELRLTGEALLDALWPAVRAAEGLAVNGHLAAKHLLARFVRSRGVKVLLTGEGADEVFAGYPHLRPSADDPADVIARGIMLEAGEGLPVDAVRDRLGLVPTFLRAKASLGRRLHAVLDRGFLAEFAGRDPYAELLDAFDVPGRLIGRDPLDQALYLWCRTALPVYILRTLGDGTEAPAGVEGRLPFLDGPLVDLAARVPAAWKVRDGREKHVLREAARPFVPSRVVLRRKQPLYAPPLGALAPRALAAVADSLPSFFDRRAVEDLAARIAAADGGPFDGAGAATQRALDPVAYTILSATAIEEGLLG